MAGRGDGEYRLETQPFKQRQAIETRLLTRQDESSRHFRQEDDLDDGPSREQSTLMP